MSWFKVVTIECDGARCTQTVTGDEEWSVAKTREWYGWTRHKHQDLCEDCAQQAPTA